MSNSLTPKAVNLKIPKTTLNSIVNTVLPDTSKSPLDNDVIPLLQDISIALTSFVTAEVIDRLAFDNRGTISSDDIMDSLSALNFDPEYIDILAQFQANFLLRTNNKKKRKRDVDPESEGDEQDLDNEDNSTDEA